MLKFSHGILSVALILSSAVGVQANDIPKNKQTKLGLYLTAAEAGDMLANEDVLFVDIRSRAEVAFLGLPKQVDVHIPYMVMPMMAAFNEEKGVYDLELNPDFPVDFKSYAEAHGVSSDSRIILMCRSGSRSARAADLLADMGYTQVYSLIDGYEGDKAKEGPGKGQRLVNGWRNAGLEWSYKQTPQQVYPADLF
ncbi:rhodanese-like domain-containing protein [Marivita geojedonensis]|uniref:rhodanese-like domain-containing protein n=1 Tax=Marivita geojedonensis TaxID=1123756 RepID=UPI000A1ECAEA|nr:rhodanese-like domain-containing protein [Marivita geojedonensis]PRY69321.1 rhodanese-related sulfurtransferase [Marivita geojedonensis]